MTDAQAPPRRSRFACLLLIGVTLWIVLPHHADAGSSRDGRATSLTTAATIAAVHVAFLAAWLVHGSMAALIAAVLVVMARPQLFPVNDALQRQWMLAETSLLAVLGLLLLMWSELGRRRSSLLIWALAAVGGIAALAPLGVLASHTADHLQATPTPSAKVGMQRLLQATVVLFTAGGLLGAWQAYRRRICPRFSLVAAPALALLVPAAAFGVARLFAPMSAEHLLNGAAWTGFTKDFAAWVDGGGYLAAVDQSWAWAPPWPLLVLMLLGLWRAIGRGFRQRRYGQMPVAWVIALGTGVMLSVIPAFAPSGVKLLSLVLATSLLPVFGIFDLLYLLSEGLVLRTPESNETPITFNGKRRG